MQTTRGYRPSDDINLYNTVVVPNRLRRISWGAILAGTFIALITMFALYMLGLSIGAATVNPARDVDPLEGLGTGTVIWMAATMLISLFAGGYTAGRMAGLTDDGDGVLHGLVTWAVTIGISLVLLTSSIGGLVSGMTNALTSVIATAGDAAADVAPQVASAIGIQDETLMSIQAEARTFLPVAPAATGEEGVGVTAPQADAPVTLQGLQLNRDISNFLALNPDAITDADRDQLAASMAARTTLSEQEARERINEWEAYYMEVRTEAEALARQTAQDITDVIALLAGAVFALMVLGAFAAGAGGYVATEVMENKIEEEVADTTSYSSDARAPSPTGR